MNSPAFLVVASAALFVLLFQGGEANLKDDIDYSYTSPSEKWLEINTHGLVGGKISCVINLTRDDYDVTSGLGAYKMHTRETTWTVARRTCLAEGGQLAVVDSQRKLDFFVNWKREMGNMGLWLGAPDQYVGGTWVTVTGDPIDTIGYYLWSDDESNNLSVQDCAVLWRDGKADYKCTRHAGFICEITLCETLGHRMFATGPAIWE